MFVKTHNTTYSLLVYFFAFIVSTLTLFILWTYFYKYPAFIFRDSSFENIRYASDWVNQVAYENNFLGFRDSYFRKFGQKVYWYPQRELITKVTSGGRTFNRYQFYGYMEEYETGSGIGKIQLFTGEELQLDLNNSESVSVLWQDRPGDFPNISYYELMTNADKTFVFCPGNVLLLSSVNSSLGFGLKSFNFDFVELKEVGCDSTNK